MNNSLMPRIHKAKIPTFPPLGAIALFSLFSLASVYAQGPGFLELAKTGTAQRVQVAIDQGQDVNVRNDSGETPLMVAAESNADPDVIIVLWKAGADSTAQDRVGLTPLMHAARANPSPGVIAALLDAGAQINAQFNGMTALMYAAKRNPNPQVIIVLLDAGADVQAKDLAGRTAFDYAQNNENLKSSDACNRLRVAPAVETRAQPRAAWPAYLLSIFIGFGTGHLYCGDGAGVLFLVGDVAGLALLLSGTQQSVSTPYGGQSSGDTLLFGLSIWLVSRIWEISDIGRAADRMRWAGRFADIVPVIDVDIQRTSLEVGASLSY